MSEALYQARGEKWLTPVTTLDQAARHVDRLGGLLLFPGPRIEAPSLWEAVAGEDAEPFATGMGEDESRVWEWKDELPRQNLAWYGAFLYRRGSLLSPELLAALYPGRGRETDHAHLDVSVEAHRVADVLRGGPVTTAALRQIVGNKSRADRAMAELFRCLLITSAGTQTQRSGWPAGLVDLTCRRFTVGAGADHEYATARFLDTMVFTTARELSRAYGWPAAHARTQLDRMVATGAAVLAGSQYTAHASS
jgi:hypothetical protein